MGLPIKLTDSSGEQFLDLTGRGPDSPLVAGRGDDVDIRIAGGNVSRRHCMLFMHDGRWVVQDAGSVTGTLVNGQPIHGAMYLNVGDEIALGREADSPRMTIDPDTPHDSGQSLAAAPVSAQDWIDSHPDEDELPPQPVPAAQATGGTGESGPMGGAGDWEAALSRFNTTRYYVPKAKPASPAMIGLGVGIALVIALGAWMVVHFAGADRQGVAVKKPLGAPVVAPLPRSVSIFSPEVGAYVGGTAPKPGAAAGTAKRPVPTPPVRSAAPVPSDRATGAPSPRDTAAAAKPEESPQPPELPVTDPRKETPEWRNLEETRRLSAPEIAIAMIEQYRSTLADRSLDKDLDAYVEQALDQLWWRRINELSEQRDQLRKDTEAKNREIAQETSADYKKRLIGERDRLNDQQKRVIEALSNEMGYNSPSGINIYDTARLESLRQARDPQKYEKWKKWVYSAVKRSRGVLPWKMSR